MYIPPPYNHPPDHLQFWTSPLPKVWGHFSHQSSNIMEGKLEFVRTLSVAEFKRQFNVTTLNVINNPHTGKRFFQAVDNSQVGGKVALAWKTTDDTMVSEVAGDDGEAFWMLHKRQESTNIEASL